MSFGGRYSGRFAGNLAGARVALVFRAYAFDTRLGKPLRAVVQDAMVDLLLRLDSSQGGYLACLEPTSSVVRGGEDEQGFSWLYDQVGGRAPAVLVGIADEEFSPAGDVFEATGMLTIPVYVIVNSMRSRTQRQTGDAESAATPTADPGVYVILEHVLQLLAGQKPGTIGTKTKELRAKRCHQLGADDTMEVWEIVFEVRASYSFAANRDITLELGQIETYSKLAVQPKTDPPLVETTTVIP